AFVVVRDGVDDGVVRRHARLDYHRPSLRTSPGAARNLSDELKSALRRAKIGQVDSNVGVDDADKSDIREIQPLCDHLRAEENVDLPCCDAIENARVRP